MRKIISILFFIVCTLNCFSSVVEGMPVLVYFESEGSTIKKTERIFVDVSGISKDEGWDDIELATLKKYMTRSLEFKGYTVTDSVNATIGCAPFILAGDIKKEGGENNFLATYNFAFMLYTLRGERSLTLFIGGNMSSLFNNKESIFNYKYIMPYLFSALIDEDLLLYPLGGSTMWKSRSGIGFQEEDIVNTVKNFLR